MDTNEDSVAMETTFRCRICLNLSEKFYHLLTHVTYGLTTMDVLKLVKEVSKLDLSLKIIAPLAICSPCMSRLADAYCFVKMLQKSENYWCDFNNSLDDADMPLPEKQTDDALTYGMPKVRKIPAKQKLKRNALVKEKAKEHNEQSVPENNDELEICWQTIDKNDDDELASITLGGQQTSEAPTEILQNQRTSDDDDDDDDDYAQTYSDDDFDYFGTKVIKFVEIKTPDQRYRCNYCNRTYGNRCTLFTHLEKIHHVTVLENVGSKIWTCAHCPRQFKNPKGLQAHVKKLHTEFYQPIKLDNLELCEYCGQMFPRIKLHVYRHINYKPHKCELCEKRFVNSGELRKHVRNVHTNERPIVCYICGKRFKRNSYAFQHMRSHNNMKQYRCHVCDEEFKQLHKLKNHYNQHHTGDRPNKCDVCDEGFTSHALLNMHRKKFKHLTDKTKDRYAKLRVGQNRIRYKLN